MLDGKGMVGAARAERSSSAASGQWHKDRITCDVCASFVGGGEGDPEPFFVRVPLVEPNSIF